MYMLPQFEHCEKVLNLDIESRGDIVVTSQIASRHRIDIGNVSVTIGCRFRWSPMSVRYWSDIANLVRQVVIHRPDIKSTSDGRCREGDVE